MTTMNDAHKDDRFVNELNQQQTMPNGDRNKKITKKKQGAIE